jgi:hypothetical protein
MNNPQDEFHTQLLRYGLDLGFLVSGFFGALLLSFKSKKQKISKSISCIIAGTLSANYLTPLILNFAPISIQEKAKYAVAFMMGYMGLKGLEFIIDMITDYLKAKIATKK